MDLLASNFIINGTAATEASYTGTTNNKQVTLTVATISKGAEVKVTLLADAVQDTATPANKSIILATATTESSTTLIDDVGPVIAKVEARESKATRVLVDFDEVLDANYVLSASKVYSKWSRQQQERSIQEQLITSK